MTARSRAAQPASPGGTPAPGPGRILVIRGGAIGDFLLTLPVLTALRAQFAHCHLEVLGYPHITRLALHTRLVDATRSIESAALARFFAAGSELDESWADYFAQFALILSYLYDPESVFQTNVTRCSNAQFVHGPHRPDEQPQRHATDTFLQPLERLAIFDADPIPRLHLPQPEPAPIHASFPRTLALHPGSGSIRKNWPESAWQHLVRQLVALPDWEFLLVSGEAENESVSDLARLIPSHRLQLAHQLPLPELAVRLSTCRAFIGHDSGISHLAAAVGLPGLVLWGPTNQTVWRPRSSRFRVLQSPHGLANIQVQQVINELKDLLSGSE